MLNEMKFGPLMQWDRCNSENILLGHITENEKNALRVRSEGMRSSSSHRGAFMVLKRASCDSTCLMVST